MSTDDRRKRRLARLLEARAGDETSDAPAAERDGRGEQSGPPCPAGGRKARIEQLRREIQRIEARSSARRAAAARPPSDDPVAEPGPEGDAPPAALPGEEMDNPLGRLWVRSRPFPSMHEQGTAPLCAALDFTGDMAALFSLDDSLAHFDVRRAVFLDIETTGLSLGTGTIAFLVGLGWFEQDAFRVRQLFVNRLENEPAVLHDLLGRLEGGPPIVTFNGKTFDVPVLRTRLALNRMPGALDAGGHLDLLHATRRLYKRRIGDCSLDSVERAVLGFHREGDIPSELIPEIFVDYLRTGSAERVHGVFHHNLLDVASMAALMGRMAELARGLEEGPPGGDLDDLVSLARIGLRRGEHDRAVHLLDHTSGSICAEHRVESRMHLAVLARRRGDHDAELALLGQVIEDEPDHAHAHLMLAKLLEHKLGRYEDALAHARLTEEAEGFEASAHRVARLERKLARER
jgi:hypothetical protein